MNTYELKIEEYKNIKEQLDELNPVDKYIGHISFLKSEIDDPEPNNTYFENEIEKQKYINYIENIENTIIKSQIYLENKEEIHTKVDMLLKQKDERLIYFQKAYDLYIILHNLELYSEEFLYHIGPIIWLKYHTLYRYIFNNWRNINYNYYENYMSTVDGVKIMSLKYNQMEDFTIDKEYIKPFLKYEKYWTDDLYNYMKYMNESYSYEFCENCKHNYDKYSVCL